MLSLDTHYNLRDIIDIKPLPTPSCIGEKVSVRNSTTYISPSLKKDQWKNNHERRTRQVTECGYRSVPYRPYQPVGEMCLDEKQLILSALGQTHDEVCRCQALIIEKCLLCYADNTYLLKRQMIILLLT